MGENKWSVLVGCEVISHCILDLCELGLCACHTCCGVLECSVHNWREDGGYPGNRCMGCCSELVGEVTDRLDQVDLHCLFDKLLV